MKHSKVQMLVAAHRGIQWLKLVGDIRVSLCPTLEAGFKKVLRRQPFGGVVVDLSEAEGLDSTALGMLARFGAQVQESCGQMPVLVAPQKEIAAMLRHMGFQRVFDICDEQPDKVDKLQEIAGKPPVQSESDIRRKVIDAHHALISLQGGESHLFTELLQHLEE